MCIRDRARMNKLVSTFKWGAVTAALLVAGLGAFSFLQWQKAEELVVEVSEQKDDLAKLNGQLEGQNRDLSSSFVQRGYLELATQNKDAAIASVSHALAQIHNSASDEPSDSLNSKLLSSCHNYVAYFRGDGTPLPDRSGVEAIAFSPTGKWIRTVSRLSLIHI